MTFSATLAALRATLPPFLSRADAVKLVPVYRAQTLRNLDSLGKGPPLTKVGNRVFYARDDFLDWVETRVKVEGAKK